MPATFYINLVSMSCAMAVSVMLLVSSAMGARPDEAARRWFSATVLCNILGLVSEFAVGLLLGRPGVGVRALLYALDWACYVFSALMNIFFALYLLTYLKGRAPVHRHAMLPIHLLSAASILLATLSPFTGLYSSFDAANGYHQAPLFWVAQVPPMLSLLWLMAIIVRYRARMTGCEFATLIAYIAVPVACGAVEVAVGDLWLSYFSAAVTLFLVYLNLQVEAQRRMEAQERALVESQVATTISQIQPHFIFNTLCAIAQLCKSTEAQDALTTFSEYLRVNMDSLSRKEPVPFQWELQHIKEYLWLENLRFEDKLRVVYDIGVDDFTLPVLSVQPLIENAVRYGVTKKLTSGTITLRTEETAEGYRVSVIDDGVGFDPEAPRQDGRSHTGIENIRMRLRLMCGGTLRVTSQPGRGTTAIIDIPR